MTENRELCLVVISSDGHAGALMADYRPYLDPHLRDEFDEFLKDWNENGSRNFDPPALKQRIDQEYIDEWVEKMVDTERIAGYPDPQRRLTEQAHEGVTAEILFPDFGLPFQLYSRTLASSLGHPPISREHIVAGMRAFNRWVIDFVSVAPERFAPMMMCDWTDVPAAVDEIRWGKSVGFKGILLSDFDEQRPLYHPDFAPIWKTIEDLELVVNSHSGQSSTTTKPIFTPGVPHPALGIRLFTSELFFYCHNLLQHLIWGGVLHAHPRLKVVFTEMGSSWVVPMLREMDYAYNGSYFRTDYHDVLPNPPSFYWDRQCFIGSSIFSREEIQLRDRIGIDKMMLGMDFPHHEGTLLETTKEYLRASLGWAGVPEPEARQMLGLTAAAVFGFDVDALQSIADREGLRPSDVLVAPSADLYPRGDIRKPALFG